MVDWTAAMQQTFEYYIVDPNTWKDVKKINNVIKSTISRDSEAETLGSASITMTESIGEEYIRIYLVVNQNGIQSRHALGTYMIQTPMYSFDGKIKNITMDAYTPLIELKEKYPPLGYSLNKGDNIMDRVYDITKEQVRAPVIKSDKDDILHYNFVSNLDNTWMTFVIDLLSNADMKVELDPQGQILFAPEQEMASLQPIWTYDVSNSSILYPSLDAEHDLYGIPNEVEVIYSNGTSVSYVSVVNDDPNSPTSIQNRGRKISHRITNPDVLGKPSDRELLEYATKMLKTLSSVEYTITYKHGYCPVRVGDCVRLNYEMSGLKNVKAKVISQSIECVPGCPVTEKAVFSNELWNGSGGNGFIK